MKFEEDVEEGGNRWSKPHVATLSLHSLFQLRALLTNGSGMHTGLTILKPSSEPRRFVLKKLLNVLLLYLHIYKCKLFPEVIIIHHT